MTWFKIDNKYKKKNYKYKKGDLVQRLWEDFRDGPGPDDGEGGNLGVETQSVAAIGLWQLQVLVSIFLKHQIYQKSYNLGLKT